METISSTSNQFVKMVKSLSDKKVRDNLGLFLVEGANLVKDMPLDTQIEFLMVDENKIENYSDILAKFDAKVFSVTSKIIEVVSDTKSPQGILAVVKKREFGFEIPTGNSIVLDAVSDAGNVGTILRTAAAAGFGDVFFVECADPFAPKVVRASMSGIFKLKLHIITENEAIEILKKTNSFAMDMNGKSISCLMGQQNVTLLGGNEAHGVRNTFKKFAKNVVSIDMKNNMESLNVAVALSIAMFKIN